MAACPAMPAGSLCLRTMYAHRFFIWSAVRVRVYAVASEAPSALAYELVFAAVYVREQW